MLSNIKHQEIIFWSLAISLSFITHLTLFFNRDSQLLSFTSSREQPVLTKFHFNQITIPANPTTSAEQAKTQSYTKKAIEHKPASPPKKIPKNANNVQPSQTKIKPVPQKNAVNLEQKTSAKQAPSRTVNVQKRIEKTLKPNLTPIKDESNNSQKITDSLAKQGDRQSADSDTLSNRQTQLLQYTAVLLRHIEKHKQYPRLARQRNIQGKVEVSFDISPNAQIHHLQLQSSKSILTRATRQAIDKARPLPLPKSPLNLPVTIEFTMNYFLQ